MQRIPSSSCAKKGTVDVDILVTLRNGDRKIMKLSRIVNTFLANIPLLYSLETSENQKFVFRGYRSGILARKGHIILLRLDIGNA